MRWYVSTPLIVLGFMMGWCSPVSAQPSVSGNRERADSLIQLYDRTAPDSVRVYKALEIGEALKYIDLTTVIAYLKEANQLLEAGVEYHDPEAAVLQHCKVLNALSTAYGMVGDHNQAVAMQLQRLALAEAIGDLRLTATALGNIASFHGEQGNHEDDLAYSRRVVNISLQLDDPYLTGLGLGNLGSVLSKMQMKDSAIHYYHRSLYYLDQLTMDQDRNGAMGWMIPICCGVAWRKRMADLKRPWMIIGVP